jgi:Coenzyme PQQ synthesis protein D (PqqD)
MEDALAFEVPDSIITSPKEAGGILLLDASTQRYCVLNETAAFLWAEIERGRTVRQMTDALCRAFVVDADVARKCVLNTILSLEERSLVSRLPKEHQP